MVNAICRFLVWVQNTLVNYLVIFGNSPITTNYKLVRLGTSYGGWWVPKHVIEDSQIRRVALSVGIGHDVSFDKEILKSGFCVIALDPLTECVDFARKELDGFSNLYLENLGLATHSGQERFYAPRSPLHDSWSSTNSQLTGFEESIVFEVISLRDLLIKYESNIRDSWTKLKMDIEGAAIEVMNNILNDNIFPKQIAVEFEVGENEDISEETFQNFSGDIVKLINKLKSLGYTTYHMPRFSNLPYSSIEVLCIRK